jgi:hypothetical protein
MQTQHDVHYNIPMKNPWVETPPALGVFGVNARWRAEPPDWVFWLWSCDATGEATCEAFKNSAASIMHAGKNVRLAVWALRCSLHVTSWGFYSSWRLQAALRATE